MAVTILEALQNANYNLDNMRVMPGLYPVVKSQLNNALVLLEKGWPIYQEVEPLLEEFGDVENVPSYTRRIFEPPSPADVEPKYRAETCQSPIGETGDYDSWIELVTPDFNLQCYDPDVDLDQVQELADALNRADISDALLDDSKLKQLIWEDWEGEIKNEDPRQMVFKYMKLMRSAFVKK